MREPIAVLLDQNVPRAVGAWLQRDGRGIVVVVDDRIEPNVVVTVIAPGR